MNLRRYKLIRRILQCPYSVTDARIIRSLTTNQLRESSKIVIIDDQIEEMSALIERLRSNKFNITPQNDITSLNDIEAYDIVIIDLQGVGKKIDPDEEGFGVIKQISKNYPEKGLGVYSGNNHKLKENIPGLMVIQKDGNNDHWTSIIDTKLENIKNPCHIWKFMACKLINNDVSAKIIAKIEDDYFDRIINNKSMDGFPDVESLDVDLTPYITLIAKAIQRITTS